jgi:hypothetical protein
MGVGIKKIERRRKAKSRLIEVVGEPDHTIVIHYSCESFVPMEPDAPPRRTSSRITSLAVRNLGSAQSTSFSIHRQAERAGMNLDELEQHYDELERRMLNEFYAYVQGHVNENWLHWNMRNMQYGFAAIAHRYQVLGGDPLDIPEEKRFDLARHLHLIYGDHYIGHPHLVSIMKKNKLTHPEFLDGPGEAIAFERRDYVRLHQSTLTKVDIISHLAERAFAGTLKTEARLTERYSGVGEWIGEMVSSLWWIIIPLTVCSVGANILQIISFFRGTP